MKEIYGVTAVFCAISISAQQYVFENTAESYSGLTEEELDIWNHPDSYNSMGFDMQNFVPVKKK